MPEILFIILLFGIYVSGSRGGLLYAPPSTSSAPNNQPGNAYWSLAIQQDPNDWRARLALARALRSDGRAREAIGLLTRALEVHPHALAVHLEMLRALHDLGLGGPLLTQYLALAESTLIYADPHVCSVCHYRAGEILWRCPHCHEWGTMVEERVAPTDARR